MTPSETCIGIFTRAAQTQPERGQFLQHLRGYLYAAALPDNARIGFGDEANADVMIRNTHLRFDFTHAGQRKEIMNGHTVDFERELAASGIEPQTLEQAVHAARSAACDYIHAHVSNGHIFDNDSDFRANVADQATLRVAPIFGLN